MRFLIMIMLLFALIAPPSYGQAVIREQGGDKLSVGSGGEVEFQSGSVLDVQAGTNVVFGKTDTVPTGPAEGWMYWDDSENILKVYSGSSWVALSGGTFTGGSITSDCTLNNGVDILSSTTTAHTNAIQARDIDGAAYVDVLRWTNGNDVAAVLGSSTVGLTITSTGLNVTSAGAITAAGLTTTGAAVSLNASSNYGTSISTGTSTGAISLGGGSNTVAVNSSSWDIATTGAASGFSTLSLSGDITLATGKGVKSSTTTAETAGIYGYDVDGAAYVGALVVTNGDTPATVLGNANGTTAITSTDWAIGTTGAMTGIGAITMDGALTVNNATITLYGNEAIIFGHATNGAADDLTISLTGATDSSIILSSAGTGEDAISLQSSAGGVDIDAAAAKDVNVAGGQVALVSKDNAASAISLTANIGTSETIVATNTQGTGEGAITLTSTAGGVDVDAAAAKNIDLSGGQVLISSKDNAASAIALTTNVGATETVVVTNTQGTGAGAITLTATAGGITFNASSGITTGDTVTGDGTAALGGFLKTVTDDTNGKTLSVTESGTAQTNAGAGGAAAWTLPAAAPGLEYTFVVMAAQELRVTPAAGDVVNIAGTAGDAAEYWTANAVGEVLHLIAVDATNWIAISYTGTWTQATP